MRLIKVFSLAAIAAVAAMALIGASSASAAGEVVLCKELVATCPSGSQWPSGTVLKGLANDPELLGTLTILCEDSTVEGKTTALSGNPLGFSITSLEFGVLPTPSLGSGCSECLEGIHVALPIAGNIKMEGTKYFLNGTGRATLKGCTFLHIDCTYEGVIKSEITHTGEHPNHAGKNLPTINISTELIFVAGSGFCGNDAVWDAEYVLTLATDPATQATGLAWPSLN
jgi:hypothetical protein